MSARSLQLLDSFPDPRFLTKASAAEHRALLDELRAVIREAGRAEDVEELASAGAMHPDPWVRHALVEALAEVHPEDTNVRAMLAWVTHDTDDFVAFSAIRAVKRHRITTAVNDLLIIVGRPSERLSGSAGKPVGIGHALVLDAITDVLDTSDYALLREIEDRLYVDPNPPDVTEFDHVPTAHVCDPTRHDHSEMVFVPGGSVMIGTPRFADSAPRVFDWSDVSPGVTIEVAPFWIDRCQVTAEDYDRFAVSADARTHRWCHAAEPPDKLHVRNTLLDERFGPHHPATGVDWFDAFAYAQSRGKRLPRETEWQRAGQGDDDRPYPWGPNFEPARAQWIGNVVCSPTSIDDWRRILLSLDHDAAAPLTVPVDELEESASPFGVVGLSGNAWEWTASSFYWRDELAPEVGSRDAVEVLSDLRSYPVIRGGSWSSVPELMSVAFRGRDLLTDRHFENGFRCSCDCPRGGGDHVG